MKEEIGRDNLNNPIYKGSIMLSNGRIVIATGKTDKKLRFCYRPWAHKPFTIGHDFSYCCTVIDEAMLTNLLGPMKKEVELLKDASPAFIMKDKPLKEIDNTDKI